MPVLDLPEVQILAPDLLGLLYLLECQMLALKAQTSQALAVAIKEIQVSLSLKILEMEINCLVAKILAIWVILQMQDILIKAEILHITDKDKNKWNKTNNSSNNILIQAIIIKIKEAITQQRLNMMKIVRIKMEQTWNLIVLHGILLVSLEEGNLECKSSITTRYELCQIYRSLIS